MSKSTEIEFAACCYSDQHREEHLTISKLSRAGICPCVLTLVHIFFSHSLSDCPILSSPLFYSNTLRFYCSPPLGLVSHLCFYVTVFFYLHFPSHHLSSLWNFLRNLAAFYLGSLVYYHAINYFNWD